MSWQDNPFGSTETSSAFSDPSVTAATTGSQAADDYAAWAERQAHLFSAGGAASSQSASPSASAETADVGGYEKNPPRPPPPRPSQPTRNSFAPPKASGPGSGSASPPAYSAPTSSSYSSSSSPSDIAAREAALRAKEEALAAREREVDERERRLDESGLHPPNWPPFPVWCVRPFKPFLYHNIDEEIPQQHQRLVRMLFRTWIFTCIIWFLNAIGCFSALVGCSDCTDTGSSFAVALIFLFVFCPAAFVCWFRVIYNGLKKDKTLNFFMFFFVFGFQIATSVLFCLGIPSTGAAGWIVGFQAINKNNVVAVIIIVIAFFWTVHALLCVFLLRMVYNLYKGSGGTIQDAQREAIGDIASSRVVREGAKDSILRNAM